MECFKKKFQIYSTLWQQIYPTIHNMETGNFVQLSEKSDTHSILIHMHFVSIYMCLFYVDLNLFMFDINNKKKS